MLQRQQRCCIVKLQPEMVGHQQADAKPQPQMVGLSTSGDPQNNSIWTALAEFHAASQTYPKVRAYFIDGDLWDSKGRLICKASVGAGLATTLRLDPLDPRSGLVACLVPTFYSGLFEAVLVGLFGGGMLSVVLGALAAYTISAAIYLAIVKSTDSVSADPVEAAFADTECTFECIRAFPIWSHRRCGPAPIRFGVGLPNTDGPSHLALLCAKGSVCWPHARPCVQAAFRNEGAIWQHWALHGIKRNRRTALPIHVRLFVRSVTVTVVTANTS